MEEEKREVEKTEEPSVLQRMEKIETLMIEQVEQGKKSLKSSRVHTAILLVFVVVFAIGMFVMNVTLKEATRELPSMLTSITQLTDTAAADLDTTIAKLNEIDFSALNDTIKGIASIRFDVLSDSIESLQSIIKPFAGFMGAFG